MFTVSHCAFRLPGRRYISMCAASRDAMLQIRCYPPNIIGLFASGRLWLCRRLYQFCLGYSPNGSQTLFFETNWQIVIVQ